MDLRAASRANDYALVKKLVSGIVPVARSHDQSERSSSKARRAF